MNRHRHHNIRNGIVWVHTHHSTCTWRDTMCVIELWTHQKFESLKKNPTTNIEFESANLFQKPRKSFELVWTRIVVAPLPYCDGQAAVAIGVHPDEKRMIKNYSKFPNQHGYVFKTYMADVMGTHWRYSFSTWTKLIRTPTCGTLDGETVRQSMDGSSLEKIPNWECLFVHKKTKFRPIWSMWMTSKMTGKKRDLTPMWKKLMKDVDIEEPTSFLDHAYLGCTQRERKPNDKIIGQYNMLFEPRISAGATEKLPGWDKPRAKTSAWPSDMEGHARKCVERYCAFANKKRQQLCKVCFVFAWTITKSKMKKWKIKVRCQKFTPILYQKNACPWHELIDMTFCAQSTNWQQLSQNGLEHVTDDWND